MRNRSNNNASSMEKVKSLRKKYPQFIYESYDFKITGSNLEIRFSFSAKPDIQFQPKIVIKNINLSRFKKLSKTILENFIFHLGLMEIPTYWKAVASPEIVIKAGSLDKNQIQWWKKIILNGMGEFFYNNKIDFKERGFLKIQSEKTSEKAKKDFVLSQISSDSVMIPLSGGKDSTVTMEVLKKADKKTAYFCLNPTNAVKKIIKVAGIKNPIIVKRNIDKKLLLLNQKGFLNGHTPFSAYLSFLSSFLAIIFNCKYIAFSNERSSNEGNVKYLGKIINHQYSKSFYFEKAFDQYSKKYLLKEIECFSFLRPLYEIQAVKLFSKFPKYFLAFLSCNEACKTYSGIKKPIGKWCGNCSKCLFVFTCLYPFIKESQLLKIFNKNLFKDKKLLPVMQELIGEKRHKPFECVGTKEESLIAFYLSWKKIKKIKSYSLPPFLLKYFERNILPKYSNLDQKSKRMLVSFSKLHNLPKSFEKLLFNFYNRELLHSKSEAKK